MANFDALNKAKKAAELATQSASDLAVGMRDQAAAKVGGLKDLMVGKIAEVKDAAVSSVKEMVADLNARLPALGEAGYALSGVSVELGIPPKVVATFTAQSEITEERIETVIEQHQDAKVTVALLRALYGAYKLQNGIQIAGMKPRGIELEIGVAPSVNVKFA
jgi:hypothetical protein